MSQTQSLFPINTKVMAVSVTASASASQALPSSGDTIFVYNEGPSLAFVSVGTGSQTATLPATTGAAATTTCFPVPAGALVTFGIPEDLTTNPPTPLNISAICRASGTALLDVAVNRGC